MSELVCDLLVRLAAVGLNMMKRCGNNKMPCFSSFGFGTDFRQMPR